jgi:hypothetical protein
LSSSFCGIHQQLTGFIFAKLNWNEVLENVFAEPVNGIDCVIETATDVFTYVIVDGTGIFQ